MQRYFVKGNIDNFILSDNDIFHMSKVMRYHTGEKIELVIEEIVYVAEIASFSPFAVEKLVPVNENRELKNSVTLLYCLPKGDKMDLVLQKATELGVKEIVGLVSTRTVVRLETKDKNKKLERYQRIIKEAAEQSKRSIVPTFKSIIDFNEIDKLNYDYKFIAYENEALDGDSLYTYLSEDIPQQKSIAIIVGAEGGFSREEVQYANDLGYLNVALGRRILRSETAALYALSVIAFMLERK